MQYHRLCIDQCDLRNAYAIALLRVQLFDIDIHFISWRSSLLILESWRSEEHVYIHIQLYSTMYSGYDIHYVFQSNDSTLLWCTLVLLKKCIECMNK